MGVFVGCEEFGRSTDLFSGLTQTQQDLGIRFPNSRPFQMHANAPCEVETLVMSAGREPVSRLRRSALRVSSSVSQISYLNGLIDERGVGEFGRLLPLPCVRLASCSFSGLCWRRC